MNEIKKLLDVKSLLSIGGLIVFLVLAISGQLTTENVMVILVMIFQSFFGYQNNKSEKQHSGE
ncbi:MAG: hypothetical protein K9L62_06350 [Vallitaleaceae bacterium]|nr:hypothetical protein [Vallitaleaceae bacterium]